MRMRLFGRPSLGRRITIAFLIGYGLVLLLFVQVIGAIGLIEDDAHLGADVALESAFADLDRPGPLSLPGTAEIRALARENPKLWVLAVRNDGRALSFGTPPPVVIQLVRRTQGALKSAEMRVPANGGPSADLSIERRTTGSGFLTIAAGGVNPMSIGRGAFNLFSYRTGFFLAIGGLLLLTLPAILIAVPIVLRGVRPLVSEAARIDPADLRRRLPEEGTPRELLPLARAFNAALERVADAFERRRRFIADVAHELRTPLAILNMHVDGLAQNSAKADLQRVVFRLGQMVGQMLDAERLTLAGRRRDPVDLVALARAAVADAAPLAIASGYDIALEADEESVWIDADAHALARALGNLLGNAIAHGGNKGLIEVSVSRDAQITVRDEGPGVPDDARDRIFEPFHRERWDKDGCGLGLHLVREIMVAHGGSAMVLPGGAGAAFRLAFARAG